MELLSAVRSAGGNEIPAALIHINHLITRAEFDALVSGVNLSPGELYLIDDESTLLCALDGENYIELPAWPSDPLSQYPVGNAYPGQTTLFTGYPSLALITGGTYRPVQPHLGVERFCGWNAISGSTNVSAFGIPAPTTTGTATSRSVAATDVLTRTARVGYVSSSTAGSSCGARRNTNGWYRSIANGAGGFTAFFRFAVSDASPVTGGRLFVGMNASTAAISNVEPSSLTNIIGIGADTTDNNMQLIHNDGSGTATKIDLGASFPARNLTNGLYDLVLNAPATDSGYVNVKVFYSAGDGSAAYIEYQPNNDLPAPSQALTAHFWRNNGAVASAVGIDVAHLFIEQPK
jgi:hypothetical protein